MNLINTKMIFSIRSFFLLISFLMLTPVMAQETPKEEDFYKILRLPAPEWIL